MSSIFNFSNVSFLYEMFRTAFDGIEWFLVLYLLCLACFYVVGRDYLSFGFLYPVVFMLLTIFNPFLIIPLAERIGLVSRIRRLFWLIPLNLVIAVSFTALCFAPRKRQSRTLLAIMCITLIATLGTSVKPYLRMPQNIYKTSDTILEISDILAEDSARTGLEKRALYSSQQLIELRQYDPSIRNVLRRTDLLDWSLPDTDDATVQEVIDSGHHLHRLALVSRYGVQIDQDAFLESMRRTQVNYIIAHYDMELHDYYESAGYEQIAQAGDFQIYRLAETGR